MQATSTFALLLMAMLTGAAITGCGDSLESLNKRAATGSIHEDAPVVAHVQVQIAAPPGKVWELLIDAPNWPRWQKQIESVEAVGPLTTGARFTWRTNGSRIQSQVQLFETERRLAWTGTAFTAKAVHVWELKPIANNQTVVIVKESMDGPLMANMFPSTKLRESDYAWLAALKGAAEQEH